MELQESFVFHIYAQSSQIYHSSFDPLCGNKKRKCTSNACMVVYKDKKSN